MRLVRWISDLNSGTYNAIGGGDCSFCGMPRGLTDGGRPGVNICDGCVDICIRILEDRMNAAGLEDGQD